MWKSVKTLTSELSDVGALRLLVWGARDLPKR